MSALILIWFLFVLSTNSSKRTQSDKQSRKWLQKHIQ